jgi:hypothetical protein
MFENRWQRVPVLLVTPAVAAVALGLAGCGSSPSNAASPSASTASPASTGNSAGVDAQTVTFTAAKLRTALLTKINGVPAAMPAAQGTYSTLPGMKQAKEPGVTVSPTACADNSAAGFNTTAVESAPAASVAFKVGGNGVSEVLMAPSASAAATAIEQEASAQCAHYTATVDGKTYDYSVKDSAISGIGQDARVINVQTAGYPSDDVWSILYRGNGFVGAVTVVGPNSSETAVREVGSEAYKYAVKALS